MLHASPANGPVSPSLDPKRQRTLHQLAIGSLVALIALCLAWESVLAPLRPGGSWLILKGLPLLFPLGALIRRNLYTMQWTAMLMMLYLTEGIVRAGSDHGQSATLACLEIALSLLCFFSLILYVQPYKKAAKAAQKKAPDKRSA